jgi:hypothetical protein
MRRLIFLLTLFAALPSLAAAQIGPPGPPAIITRGHAML